MREILNPSALASLLPAAMLTLAMQTGPYALAAEGDALAPRVKHGEVIVIVPAVGVNPATIEPGSVVLAAVATDPAQPRSYNYPSLFTMNADYDLTGGRATAPSGSYLLLGVVQEEGGRA